MLQYATQTLENADDMYNCIQDQKHDTFGACSTCKWKQCGVRHKKDIIIVACQGIHGSCHHHKKSNLDDAVDAANRQTWLYMVFIYQMNVEFYNKRHFHIHLLILHLAILDAY